MKVKDSFRPTRRKVIVSFVLTLLYIALMNFNQSRVRCDMMCIPVKEKCFDFINLLLVKPACHCPCTTPLNSIFPDYLFHLVIPFVIIYLIYSLLSSLIINKKTK